MEQYAITADLREKSDFPLWDGVFCPEYFENQLKFYPDPNIKIYYFSLNGKDIILENGFSTEKDETWNAETTLCKFLEYATREGWRVGESWGFSV